MKQTEQQHVIISGSPRAAGRCAHVARTLAAHDSAAVMFFVSDLDISGCTGCDACRAFAPRIRCAKDDDMAAVLEALDSAQHLTIVSPLYFAGPPSQLKALLDRLQPHYWAGTRKAPKRPATLYAIGEGGDPHGAEPLITIVRSALAVAGFALDEVHVQVGGNG